MIRRFDSIAALLQRAEETKSMTGNYGDTRNDWFGETLAETQRFSKFGDQRLVPEAETVLEKLDTQIETPRRVWERGPVGAYCVVPDVLAGLPTPMRFQHEIGDERAPVTILSISTSSGGIDAKVLMKRGTAILALVLALSRVRPISLHSVSILDGRDNGESVLSTRIETAPLDLSMACYALTSAGFARRLNYSLSKKIDGSQGFWPTKFNYFATPDKYYNYLAELLAPDPKQTLVIGAAKLNDPILQNPILWINTQIRRFTETQEAD